LWETDEAKLYAKVVVPITSLCPCSKEISDYGAHNQRSHVTVLAALNIQQPESFQSIIQTIEQEASCELFSTLKRADEKWVTERAYDNPKFVEDLIRDIANRLSSMSNILGYRISCENFESIHNHSAYAFIERGMDTYA
ncbi:MAG: GTP cyclohydrolase, FolE2/MptA family, partial [Pseudomonadota bacterium]